MQKKIIVLAIAAALTAPAAFAADASNVTVYGKVFANYENIKSSSVAAGKASSLNRITSDATRFGVKGSEDLGDGLKAIWQLEAQFNVDGSGNSGFGGGTRNSHVGLEGDFGTAFLGRWDSPYKVAHNKIELFDNTTVFSANNIIGAKNGAVASDFNNRISNSVQYWTPKMNGFQAKLAYGTDVAKTSTTNATALALNATYENDMFYGAYAYQKFNDTGAVPVANSNDTGNRLVGAFKFEGGMIGATYETLENKTLAATSKRNAWELMGEYAVGANNFGLTYAVAGNMGATAASGAKNLSVKYGYKFSKRTEIFAAYTALSNDTAGTYNFNHGSLSGSAAGAKLSGFGVGMVHSF